MEGLGCSSVGGINLEFSFCEVSLHVGLKTIGRPFHLHDSSGHAWQERYKLSGPGYEHLLTVLRYIEGNPVRAGGVHSARDWAWSSHRQRAAGSATEILADLPIALSLDWTAHVDEAAGAVWGWGLADGL